MNEKFLPTTSRILVTIVAIGLCQMGIGALSAAAAQGNPEPPSGEQSVRDDMRAGRDLTPEEVASLEAILVNDPNDASARTKLLAHYGGRRSIRDQSAKDVKREHALWFIRNAPESRVLAHPEARVNHVLDPDGYSEARKAWLDQLEREPENANIAGHAADFFMFGDRRTSIKLLKRAQSLDSSNAEWPRKLGQLYSMGARDSMEVDKRIAAQALKQYERAYELSHETGKDSLLEQLAKAAFDADRLDKAGRYAELMLQNTESGWNYGNRVHHGNLVLGRIALREGNVEEAKSRLIAAGKTPGSPQLNSFGPNMALAKALLEVGERDVVLEYFQLCSKFWKSERAAARLDEWGVLVAAGRVPEFRANLVY